MASLDPDVRAAAARRSAARFRSASRGLADDIARVAEAAARPVEIRPISMTDMQSAMRLARRNSVEITRAEEARARQRREEEAATQAAIFRQGGGEPARPRRPRTAAPEGPKPNLLGPARRMIDLGE